VDRQSPRRDGDPHRPVVEATRVRRLFTDIDDENLVDAVDRLERGLLGSLMIVGAAALPKVAPILPILIREAHRTIYTAIANVAAEGADPDLILVIAALAREGQLEHAGGAGYVSSLLDQPPDVENVVHYARHLKELAILRKAEKGSRYVNTRPNQEAGRREANRTSRPRS
jgi:replicative DNA helicase